MDIIYSFLIIIAAVFVLIQAGKYVVRSLGVMARFLRVSEYVLSFVLIAFATSLPELSVGINSALLDVPELSFGDILGTNVVNITFILGILAVIGGNITVKDYKHFKNNRVFEFMIVLAPLIMMLDGTLSRIDGGVLLVLFVWNIFRLLDIDDMILGRKVLRPHLTEQVNESAQSRKSFLKNIFIFIASTAILLGSTVVIVTTVKGLSVAIGISNALIGVLVVATATSLPDFAVGLRSVRKKHGGVALGDIFGAAAINSTLILGIVSLISPITLHDLETLWIGLIFIILAFALSFFFLKTKNSISRKEGAALLGLYAAFLATQILVHIF